ncbi:hypothetical protein Cni_G07931 [Canna indica]|uniref:Uncharacterized protein n=1 Tax=Canna indica TaxID=4628 RepID=A0AAQ3Q833_9LILI|nr:hypothetical protein Cni_G07931 [Canna indica]
MMIGHHSISLCSLHLPKLDYEFAEAATLGTWDRMTTKKKAYVADKEAMEPHRVTRGPTLLLKLHQKAYKEGAVLFEEYIYICMHPNMIHLGHSVAGVLRLHPNPITRLVPVSRRGAGNTVSFSSASQAEPPQDGAEERKMNKNEEQKQQQQMGTDPTNTDHHHGDVMTHSFGEGYSTRSDEEGFGGIYGGNQALGNRSEIDHHVDL